MKSFQFVLRGAIMLAIVGVLTYFLNTQTLPELARIMRFVNSGNAHLILYYDFSTVASSINHIVFYLMSLSAGILSIYAGLISKRLLSKAEDAIKASI